MSRVLRVLHREPAVVLALVASVVQLVSALVFNLSDEQQGVLNGFAAVVAGVVVAWSVSLEKALPLLVGLVQALLAVALAFGFEVDPTAQSAVLAVVGSAVALFVRTQVTTSSRQWHAAVARDPNSPLGS